MNEPDAWISAWLDSVVAGESTMSQRVLSSVEKHGGLEALCQLAQKRGVHVLLVEDDHGRQILAASLKPFRVIC